MAPLARWLICIACIVVTMATARAANASAPFCDHRGMSANAPPPVMPARDIRLDLPKLAPPCELVGFDYGVKSKALQERAPVPSPDPPVLEAASLARALVLPSAPIEAASMPTAEAFDPPRGHAQGVFHPPRG